MEQSAIQPLLNLSRFLLLVMIGVVAFQIYLNPAHKRPAVVCWPIYQTATTIMVRIPKLLLPSDPVMHLRNTERTNTLYFGCTKYAEHIPFFGGEPPVSTDTDTASRSPE